MSIKSVGVAITAVILLITGSCDNGSGPTQQGGDGKKAYGVISFTIDQDINTVSFTGTLKNGLTPVVVSDTVMTSGECRLIKTKTRICQDCSGVGDICVDNNNCQHEPGSLTAGTLTVSGYTTKKGNVATASPAKLINGNYLLTGDYGPGNPFCTEGGTISVTASGNDSVTGFTLTAKTISKIEISTDSIPMNPGQDIHLTWKAPANPNDSRITAIVDIAYHGSGLAKIVCDCADDGDLIIPGAMLDSLKSFGLAGHPKLELYRTSIGTSPTTGAKISIQATLKLWLKIPGLISCTTDGEKSSCPDGYTCEAQHCVEVK